MYERFTDRACEVMQLANQEAQRFNHEYIGTEHILLGLVKDETGVACNVLKNLGVDLRGIRLETEKHVTAGPEMVTMGRLPQTPLAKLAIEHTITEARQLGHNYVGTEHLLLGLLREPSIATVVLQALGVTAEAVRAEVLDLLAQPKPAEFKATFADGDVVMLKSGGPAMTVAVTKMFQGIEYAECVWFDGSVTCGQGFAVFLLKKDPR